MYLTNETIKIINAFLEEHKNEQFNSTELFSLILDKGENYRYSPTELAKALNQPHNQKFLCLNSKKIRNRYYYQYDSSEIPILTISNYKKVKNIIYFINEENIEFYYDFNLQKFNISLSQIRCIVSSTLKNDVNIKAYHFFNLCVNNKLKEWIFSYPELWSENPADTYMIKFDCPVGYITFLKIAKLTINETSYRLFKLSQVLSDNNLRILKNWERTLGYFSDENEKYIYSHPFLFSAIQKMYIISAKNFEVITSYGIVEGIVKFCRILRAELDNFNILDTNRGLLYNNNLLKETCDKRKDELFSLSLQSINGINHFQISDYEIIVPQNLTDLRNEGKQQHNCIGYYYNNSIIQQQNYIYFLRKKENPEQSYMTCRFSVSQKGTVEKYYKNNQYVNDKYELEILKQIDEKIKQILSTK